MPKNQSRSTMTTARSEPERASESFPIVGIGASAGGLDACKKLLSALPAETGMAFILIQHLDPTHESMMADLLAGHTSMTVIQATDGMPIEREHLYIIPPGKYFSVSNGLLRLSPPAARHGARLPFDFLLRGLAADRGAGAICVVLSGSGADGSLGLQAIKDRQGLVIAQDPEEAGFDGMPRSAIMTGAVDLVLPVEQIPDALAQYGRRVASIGSGSVARSSDTTSDWLPEIIELLRLKTNHDFTLYKQGTLRRRIERRMAMAAIEAGDMYRYLDMLRGDPNELDLLAADLLINVTSFFRDPKVFDLLASTIVPDLIRNRPHRSADPHLGRGLQHRRGDVFSRHDLPGANHGGRERREAAGVRVRRRRRTRSPVRGTACTRTRSRPIVSRRASRSIFFERRSTATGSCRNCAPW